MIRALALYIMILTPLAYTWSQEKMAIDEIVEELKLDAKNCFPFGFKPGISKGKLERKLDDLEVFSQDETYITFTIYFAGGQYNFADLSYDFNGDRLVGSTLESYFDNEVSAVKAFNLIKSAYTELYGSSSITNGTLKWTYERRGQTMELEMELIDYEADNGFVVNYLVYE